MSGTVAKHVVIMEQLSNYVTKKNLLEVSELQQQIACDIQSSQHTQVNHNVILMNVLVDFKQTYSYHYFAYIYNVCSIRNFIIE